MIVECGPINDRRILVLELPKIPNFPNETMSALWKRYTNIQSNKIGVLVSGGLDSALLYFLLIKENLSTGSKFSIVPYTILRANGSEYYAQKVIGFIHEYFNIPAINLNYIGNIGLPEINQVESGISDILAVKVDYVYLGMIELREEHTKGIKVSKFNETPTRKYPFLRLQKSHIIDLVIQNNVLDIISITYSCDMPGIVPCGNCNGCNERTWGLTQNGL